MSAVRTFSFVGVDWSVLTCEYANGHAARAAWDRLNEIDKRRGGALELGVYRHAIGLDGEPVYVSVVSHKPDGMPVAERLLVDHAHGRPVELGRDLEEAMIARRIRVMAEWEAQGKGPGGIMLRRARGAILNPDGTMAERIGGDE